MKHSLPTTRASVRTRALVTGGLVALTAAGVGGAAFASFTGSTSASQNVGSGVLSLSGIGTNQAGNRLTVDATEIAPGDTIQRAVTITTDGTVAIDGMKLSTTAALSSALDTDTVHGLQMTIDSCSQAWTESAFPYTYSCGGTVSTVLATTPVVGADRTLSGLDTAAGATNHLRVTLALPTTADDSFQNLDSTINYTFDAIQRVGTSK